MHARSDLVTIAAVAVSSYAACDMIHEVLGHGVAAFLSPAVSAVSLTSVALQTTGVSRAVAAAGSVANVIVGTIALLLAARRARLGATGWFWLLLGAVNLLNGTGYLLFSGILGIGDWAVVVDGLQPPIAWRIALCAAGAVSYAFVVWLIARACALVVAPGEASRVIVTSYVAGAALLVAGAAMNPISPALILTSGASTGFGAMAGLLAVPALVHRRGDSRGNGVIEADRAWIVASAVVAIVFVVIIGRGIRIA